MKTKQFALSVLLLSVALSLITSCTKDNPAPNEVFIQENTYALSTITVSAGTTVIWINKDNTTHTVTSDNALFNSAYLGKEKTFAYTFNTIGTYKYHCKLISGMKGVVVVN